MSTNKKYIFFVSYYLYYLYILPTNFFITRLFVIFPLLFLGAFFIFEQKVSYKCS